MNTKGKNVSYPYIINSHMTPKQHPAPKKMTPIVFRKPRMFGSSRPPLIFFTCSLEWLNSNHLKQFPLKVVQPS